MLEERDDTIESSVIRLIQGAAPAGHTVRPESSLSTLGMDSLAVADLAVALEERWGVRLADVAPSDLRTVRDVIEAARSSKPTPPRIPPGIGRLQPWSKRIAGPMFAWYGRLHVKGAEHMPPTGPVVLACNHRSFLDIPLLVIASPRPIVFMAKRELYKNWLFGHVLHELGGFPVRREVADLRAVDVGLAVLGRAEVLGVYPEGTRNYGRDLLPFLRGAAWLALLTGAPIVPCGIVGTERRPGGVGKVLRRRVRVNFGPAITPGREPDPRVRREKAGSITRELFTAVETLAR